ncbi:MAG: Asp-tRNA(Asn)/Glu-tRNA(Gln) amidotransferase subunit GatB, partial [Patescibacteria group bacterium]
GVPLMELVTEPVITSAKQAGDFARELQLLLRYLGASEANMEKGEMRVEANISVKKSVSRTLLKDAPRRVLDNLLGGNLGTKVEVKNLNSFRAVERAIEFEKNRQIELLESGEKVEQETRGWNEVKGETFSQRKKETSQDYRYFPEPDLPKLFISQIPEFQDLKKTLPELPWEKRERYARDFGVKAEDIEAYVTDLKLGVFFENITRELGGDKELIKLASNYISNDLVKIITDNLGVELPSSGNFADLIKLAKSGGISSRGTKDVLILMLSDQRSPKVIAEEKNLLQKSDEGHLQAIVEKIIAENQKSVEDFKAGKVVALQFLIGQGMKVSKGSANPKVLETLFKKRLG